MVVNLNLYGKLHNTNVLHYFQVLAKFPVIQHTLFGSLLSIKEAKNLPNRHFKLPTARPPQVAPVLPTDAQKAGDEKSKHVNIPTAERP